MKKILKRIILWILSEKDVTINAAADLDAQAKSLKQQ